MSNYPESVRICSLFANPTRAGGTYYAGKLGGEEPITILPGQRVTLVRTSKIASNGAEVWSLLLDPLGADDANRVYEVRGTFDIGAPRKSKTKPYVEREREEPTPF
jgi:hypothetical protein